MILAIATVLIGVLIGAFGVLLGLTGPNGHPAGIPTVYLGAALVLGGFLYGLYRVLQ